MTASAPKTGGPNKERRMCRDLVERSPDVSMVVGADLKIRYVSPSVERMLGYEATALPGMEISRYLHPKSLAELKAGGGLGGPEPSGRLELTMRHADGSWRCLEAVSAGLRADTGREAEERAYYVRDVTRRKAAEKELAHRALHDHLTGLANRALFMERLEHALVLAVRREEPVTVLFVDLDYFKAVNDDFGHGTGDLVLTMVAQRLRACLRPGDTVARLGGDEFAVLLEDAVRAGGAASVANRIVSTLREPISWSGHTLYVTASVGVASSSPDLSTAEELLHTADAAMYRAKEAGRARHEIFEEGLSAESRERLKLETDLRLAFEREEFRLYYQPEIDLKSGDIVSMEALLRWEHPRRGWVAPLEFISLLEENGLIVPIGRWVLGEACRQALIWHDRRRGIGPSVSVNLSARQLQQPGLVDSVVGILGETGLPPENLILEITESTFVEDTERISDSLRELKEIGVQLAIDDFGTGYSALSYLERLPADYLKIDQSFVGNLGEEARSQAVLMPLLVGLARALGMKAVAEGVETDTQAERLREMGCDMVQGYYFSAPLSARAASEMLGTDGAQASRSKQETAAWRIVVADAENRARRELGHGPELLGNTTQLAPVEDQEGYPNPGRQPSTHLPDDAGRPRHARGIVEGGTAQ